MGSAAAGVKGNGTRGGVAALTIVRLDGFGFVGFVTTVPDACGEAASAVERLATGVTEVRGVLAVGGEADRW